MLRVQYGWTALTFASNHGHAAVVKLLVAAEASLDAADNEVSAGSVLGGQGVEGDLGSYYDF